MNMSSGIPVVSEEDEHQWTLFSTDFVEKLERFLAEIVMDSPMWIVLVGIIILHRMFQILKEYQQGR